MPVFFLFQDFFIGFNEKKMRFLKITPEKSTPFFRRAPPMCSQELWSEKQWSK